MSTEIEDFLRAAEARAGETKLKVKELQIKARHEPDPIRKDRLTRTYQGMGNLGKRVSKGTLKRRKAYADKVAEFGTNDSRMPPVRVTTTPLGQVPRMYKCPYIEGTQYLYTLRHIAVVLGKSNSTLNRVKREMDMPPTGANSPSYQLYTYTQVRIFAFYIGAREHKKGIVDGRHQEVMVELRRMLRGVWGKMSLDGVVDLDEVTKYVEEHTKEGVDSMLDRGELQGFKARMQLWKVESDMAFDAMYRVRAEW